MASDFTLYPRGGLFIVKRSSISCQTMKKLLLALSLAAAAFGLQSANAQVLGTNHIGATAFYGWDKVGGTSIDVFGARAFGNYSTVNNPNYGLDLNFGGGAIWDNKKNFTLQGQQIDASLVPYYSLTQDIRPFVILGLSYEWVRISEPGFRTSDNNWGYTLGGGVEWTISPGLSITPSIAWTDLPDVHRGDTFRYSVAGDYWLNSDWAVGAQYQYVDPRGNAHGHHVGVTLRYRY